MKVFLSAMESHKGAMRILLKNGVRFKYSLISFYYARKDPETVRTIIENSDEVLVDSGAYSFQVKGKGVNWDEYTRAYCEFIRSIDCEKIKGYFEMDIDVLVGYEKVRELRRMLLSVTDKIIPVWHKNRGIQDFKEMCEEFSGRIVSISGLENRDIYPEDYGKFYNYAHNKGCLMHCLGMTKKSILDKVPFDYVDSASWALQAAYGRVAGRKCSSTYRRYHNNEMLAASYVHYMNIQKHYEQRYRNIHK